MPRDEADERPVLTPKQAQQLIEAAKESKLEVLLIVALTTGLRHGELRALRWQDIDLDKKELHVRHAAINLQGYGVVESEPKTKSSKRNIMMHAFVVEVLKSHRIAQLEQRLKMGSAWKDLGLVFPSRTGYYFSRTTLYSDFYKILAKANLPPMHIHDLRHSAATILLAMGVNIKVVQEILGHSDVSMTLRVYGHVLPGMQEEAMQKWGDVLGSKFNTPQQ